METKYFIIILFTILVIAIISVIIYYNRKKEKFNTISRNSTTQMKLNRFNNSQTIPNRFNNSQMKTYKPGKIYSKLNNNKLRLSNSQKNELIKMVKSPEIRYAIQNYFVKEYYKNSSNKNFKKSGLLKKKPDYDRIEQDANWPDPTDWYVVNNSYNSYHQPSIQDYADAVTAKMKKDSDEAKVSKTASDAAKATVDARKKYGSLAIVAIASAIKKGDWSSGAIENLVEKVGVCLIDIALTAMGIGWLAETVNGITDLWLKPATIPQLTAADIVNAVGTALVADDVRKAVTTANDVISQIDDELNNWVLNNITTESGCLRYVKDKNNDQSKFAINLFNCMNNDLFDPSIILLSTELTCKSPNESHCGYNKRAFLSSILDNSVLGSVANNTIAQSSLLQYLYNIEKEANNIETTIKIYPLFVQIITYSILYWQQNALLSNSFNKDSYKLHNPWFGAEIIGEISSQTTGRNVVELQNLCKQYWNFVKLMYQQFYNSLNFYKHQYAKCSCDYGDRGYNENPYFNIPISGIVFGNANIPDSRDCMSDEYKSGGIAPLSEDYIKQKAIDDDAARSRGEKTTPIDWWVLYNMKYHPDDKKLIYVDPNRCTPREVPYWTAYKYGNNQYHWMEDDFNDGVAEMIRSEYMFAFDEFYDNALNLLGMLKKLSGIKWLAGEEGWDYKHPNNPGKNSDIEYDSDTLGYPFGVDKLSIKQAIDFKDASNDTSDLLLSGGLYQSPVISVPISSILCRNADTYGFIADVYMNGSFNATVFNNGKTETETKDSQGNYIYTSNSGIIDTNFYSGNMTTPIGYDSALSVLKLGKSPGTATRIDIVTNKYTGGIIEPDSRSAFCMSSYTRDTTFLVDNFYDKSQPFINFNCKCIFDTKQAGLLYCVGYYDYDMDPTKFVRTPDVFEDDYGCYCPKIDASSFTSVPNVYDITFFIKTLIKNKLINMYPNNLDYTNDTDYKHIMAENIEFLFRNENSILVGADTRTVTDKSIDTFIKPSAIYRTSNGFYGKDPDIIWNTTYEITISGSLTNFRRYSLLVFEYDYSHYINGTSEYRDVAVIFRGYRTNEKNWFPVNDIRCNYVRNEGDRFFYDFKDVYTFFGKTLTSGDKIEININRPITSTGDTPTGILINDGSKGILPILDARFTSDCYNFPPLKEYYQFGICVEKIYNFLDPIPSTVPPPPSNIMEYILIFENQDCEDIECDNQYYQNLLYCGYINPEDNKWYISNKIVCESLYDELLENLWCDVTEALGSIDNRIDYDASFFVFNPNDLSDDWMLGPLVEPSNVKIENISLDYNGNVSKILSGLTKQNQFQVHIRMTYS